MENKEKLVKKNEIGRKGVKECYFESSKESILKTNIKLNGKVC